MSDYGAGWPLWGPGADNPALGAMPAGLNADLLAWQALFEEHYDHRSEWLDDTAARTYEQMGRELLARMHSVLPDFFIELDLWPTGGGTVGSWELGGR